MLSTLLLAVPAILAAEGAKPEGPVVTPEGVLFAQFGRDLTDTGDEATAGAMGFDATRAYFGAKVTRGEQLGIRVVFDVGRNKDADAAKEWAFVKFAYAEVKDVAPGVTLQGGAIPTSYPGAYDAFWGHRYVAKPYTDANKLLKTSDFGVGAQGVHAGKRVDWQVQVVNGEGYDNAGIDQTINPTARLTVDPLAGGEKNNLPITGFVSYETAPHDGDATLTWAGALGFRMPYVLVWGEYVGQSTGDLASGGYSATLMPRVPDVGSLILRYDHFDPDAEADDDAVDTVIAGVSHDFMKKVSLAATWERATVEGSDTPVHGVFVKGQAGF